jgi:CHAT domain-containing protein/tetratricopeptide (TPR) repeat protein
MTRLARLVARMVVAWGLVLAPLAVAQQDDDADALNAQVNKLHGEGKYTEAIPLAQRLLAIREKSLGPDHPGVALALNNLAELYRVQGRYAEAEPLYKRSLSIREKALGPDDPAVATDLNNLAVLYQAQGRTADAEPLLRRALTIKEKALGLDHPDVATVLDNLAELYKAQGRTADAEPLYKRSLSIREKALGPDHPDVAGSLVNLASLYITQLQNFSQSQVADTEPLLKRALDIEENALGSDHPDVANSLSLLALMYSAEGRYAEAEPLLKRSLAIREKALGPDHPDVVAALDNLAGVYDMQGRTADAAPLYFRVMDIYERAIQERVLRPDELVHVAASLSSLAELFEAEGRTAEAESMLETALKIREKVRGPYDTDVSTALDGLADLYRKEGRYADAEPLYKRALGIDEKALGPDNPLLATSISLLGLLYQAEGRAAEAEPSFKRTMTILEKAFGPEHPRNGAALNYLVRRYMRYRANGYYAKAQPLLNRALVITENGLGPDHPNLVTVLNNLAALSFDKRDWPQAAEYWRRSTAVIIRRAARGTNAVGQALTGKGKSEAEKWNFAFYGLVKVIHRLGSSGRGMFETAQWARSSEVAASLAQMAARGGTAKPAPVRERQDLVVEWQKRDAARSAAVSQPPDKRDKQAEAANGTRLAEIDTRIDEIDKQLAKDFPDYAALVSPKPISITDVQSQLRDGEALVLFLDTPEWKPTPEETFIWVMTKTDSRWVKSDIGTKALGERVAALRCGLDYDGSWGAPDSRCAELLKTTYSEADHESGKSLPFDINRSHELYKALFGQIEDVIKDKHLLIVPSGALTQLPFHVLVTEKPDQGLSGLDALRHAAWLIRSHALTVLPSVSSLRALRQLAKDSHASRALIGFGDPLLDGQPDRYPDDGPRAVRARANQSCPKELSQQVASLRGGQRGVRPIALRGGMANVVQIRMQVPLPETADELCAVARDLGVSGDDIRLGAHATETEIKRLNRWGDLAKYRIVHFATHGALAGQVGGDSEPGLLLTPPGRATKTDDGYLSASEIAGLKLDADWVILSACNTAAGGAEGAEALSGLARAFFYAGARALLVSHWSVYSDATVKLITGAIDRMTADKSVGRAEAMRQSMLALIDKGAPYEAHPAFWAPFIVVGEGAARSQ